MSIARERGKRERKPLEPADQFYGDRTYMAVDLEGHHWTFSQPVRNTSREEMEQASGFKYKALE